MEDKKCSLVPAQRSNVNLGLDLEVLVNLVLDLEVLMRLGLSSLQLVLVLALMEHVSMFV